MSKTMERYVVEIISPDRSADVDYSDLDEAARRFYREVADNYDEPSHEVQLHDLVAGVTLASWMYDPEANMGQVVYDIASG